MSGQQLLLSWKDHNGALVSVFENLLKRNTLVDCTLAAEGQYLKAHKVVLSACSAYFELLFSQESEKNPIVILKDVKFQELRAAVNFMYKGEVEVCEDRLAAFLEVADSLQIKGLGSNRRTDSKENVSARSANEKTFSPKPSRKESATSNSDSAKENAVCDSEQSHGNESSSRRPLSHEASRQSPAQGASSSFNIHSASSSGQKAMSEHDPQEGSESPPPSHFIPVVDVTCGDSPVIKTEQGVDSYSEDKSEGEGDYGDDVIMDDQDDWDEGKGDMGSESSTQPDIGYQTQMKSEEDASGSSVPSRGDPLESAASLGWPPGAETKTWGHPGGRAPFPRAAAAASAFAQGKRGLQRAPLPFPLPLPPPAPAPKRSPDAVKSFRCSLCAYATALSADLKKHLRVHTGERPYACADCGAAFAQNTDLRRHVMTHTGERPFRCDRCSATFIRASRLREHMQLHEGKRYICEECGKPFTSREGWRYHQRTCHRSAPAAADAF